MLTWEDDLEVHALRKRGWSISAIARHTGHDRKTVRKYLAGDATPGVRARPSPDPFDPFVDYVTARLVEDPHLWARTLFDELEGLGFELSYQSLTRNIRARDLRRAVGPQGPVRASGSLARLWRVIDAPCSSSQAMSAVKVTRFWSTSSPQTPVLQHSAGSKTAMVGTRVTLL